jgi:Adenylate and Guanylate cyclase catalytic domain
LRIFLHVNDQFHAYSKDIVTRSNSQVATIFGHVSTLSTAITSQALNYNMTFPNVTLPNFDARARDVGESSLLPLVLFVPIVRDSDRAGWEAFTETQHWIEQDMKYQTNKNLHPGPMPPKIFSYSNELYKADETYELAPEDKDEEESEINVLEGGGGVDFEFTTSAGFEDQDYSFVKGASFPLWQFGPLPWNASVIKMDLATHPSFKKTLNTAMYEKREILSDAMDLDFLYNSQGWRAGAAPRSTAVVPVKEDFFEDSPVVGFVVGTLKWSELFWHILPDEVKGIVATVEDSCGQDFGFLIEGGNVVLLGYGTTENFTMTANSRFREAFEIAEAVRDNDNAAGTIQDNQAQSCELTLTLYSTKTYEDACTTSMPAVYTTVVVMVFLVTIVTFALYDFVVNRRQRKLMAQAKRSDAIVSSLFPKHVQQRMMEEAEAADTNGKWKGRLGSKQPQGDFNHDGNLITSEGARGSRPIADLYAESTIIFADIVGFTQWASCRVPSDVFVLLEAIFAAFDEAANRRRVYKVRLRKPVASLAAGSLPRADAYCAPSLTGRNGW